MKLAFSVFAVAVLIVGGPPETRAQEIQESISLFDGTFDGWEGDTKNTWRIEGEAIVAGSLEQAAPRNEFLMTEQKFRDFDLSLKFRTRGTRKINCGIQFRSQRMISDGSPTHEVIGYQADIGENVHGYLYDESRRRKFLAEANAETGAKVVAAMPDDGWQTYRIRAVGNHVQLWVNGIQTVDYTETDDSISPTGFIGLQIHGHMVGTIEYRDIVIRDLSDKPAVSINELSWMVGHWALETENGRYEETWNSPVGGEMTGSFKRVAQGKVISRGIRTIVPHGDTLVLRMEDFSEGLVVREKDKAAPHRLVSLSRSKVSFDGIEFRRLSDDEMVIALSVNQDGEKGLAEYRCKRAKRETHR